MFPSRGEKRYGVIEKIKNVLIIHPANCTPDLLPIDVTVVQGPSSMMHAHPK